MSKPVGGAELGHRDRATAASKLMAHTAQRWRCSLQTIAALHVYECNCKQYLSSVGQECLNDSKDARNTPSKKKQQTRL